MTSKKANLRETRQQERALARKFEQLSKPKKDSSATKTDSERAKK